MYNFNDQMNYKLQVLLTVTGYSSRKMITDACECTLWVFFQKKNEKKKVTSI